MRSSASSGCDQATVIHKPRLLTDNGPSYIAGELAECIEEQHMSHGRGVPFHPQTPIFLQGLGKIERWHQTLKNRISQENYFLPSDLEAQIEAFVEQYNHQRYHEALRNVTPADAYFGRAGAIINKRERIKKTNHRTSALVGTASWPHNINPSDEADPPLIYAAIRAKCSDNGKVGRYADTHLLSVEKPTPKCEATCR